MDDNARVPPPVDLPEMNGAGLPHQLPGEAHVSFKAASPRMIAAPEANVSFKMPVANIMGTRNFNNQPQPTRVLSNGQQFLAEAANSADAQDMILDVKRIGPAVWNGQPLPITTVERISPPLTLPEVVERVTQLHGGGEYRITVLDENGRALKNIPFKIDTMQHEPIMMNRGQQQPQRGLLSGSPGNSQASRTLGFASNNNAEPDDITEIRMRERKLAAEASLFDKEQEVRRKKRAAQEEDNNIQEREQRRTGAPLEAVQLQIKTIADESNRRFEALIQTMNQQAQAMQTQILAVVNKPPVKDDSMLQFMMKSMETTSQMMIAMMTSNKGGSTEVAEAMKMAQESNQRIVDMAMKSADKAAAGNPKYDRLIESIVAGSLNQKGDSVKEALALMENGRRQAMEMIEMREELRGESNEDSMDYDPDAGVLGNLGKLIFSGFKAIMKGGGGAAAIPTLLSMLGKNDPAQVQPRDLAALAHRLEGRPTLPSPAQLNGGEQRWAPPVLPPPMQQLPIQTVVPVQNHQQVLTPVPTQPRVSRPRQGHPIAEVYEDIVAPVMQQPVPVQQAQIPQPVAVHPRVDGGVSDDITEAIRLAIVDLRVGRRAHEWTEYAYDKWPRGLLDAFASASDDTARLNILQSGCAPAAFNEFQTLLLDERIPHSYPNFIQAMTTLVQDHAGVVPQA